MKKITIYGSAALHARLRFILKTLITAVFLSAFVMGCSVTSLSCGKDGTSSYVNIQSNVENLDTRTITQLCNFDQE